MQRRIEYDSAVFIAKALCYLIQSYYQYLVNYWPIRVFLYILKVSFAIYQVPPELEIIMLVTLGTKSPFLCAPIEYSRASQRFPGSAIASCL